MCAVFCFEKMRMLRIFPLFLLLASCATPPPVISFFVGDGAMQHFMATTNWAAQDSRAQLDITYRTGTGNPAIVNISFFGNRSTPQNVSSISLHGAGVEYQLENISVILVRSEKNELRITSTGDMGELIYLLNNEHIRLKAKIDGVTFIYTPGRNFDRSRTRFLDALLF